MALDTLQQRIHRALVELVMDELYDEAQTAYVAEEIPYNVANAYWVELNKRYWLAFGETNHYEFFTSVGGLVPVNNLAPALDNTTPTVGVTITCDDGGWDNEPTSFSRQWYRGASPLPEETSNFYTVIEDDAGSTISCGIIAHNASGDSDEVFSNATDVIISGDTSFTVNGDSYSDGATVNVANGTTSVTLAAVNGGASVENEAGNADFVTGDNFITFDVRAADGQTVTSYSLTIHVYNNDTSLDPSFSTINEESFGGSGNYDMPYGSTSVGLVLVATDPNASVQNFTGDVNALVEGINNFSFDVVSEDPSVTQHYTFTVTVLGEETATEFTVDSVSYDPDAVITVPFSTTSVIVAATHGGSIENEVGTSSLVTGDNVCTFTVRSADGNNTLDVTITVHVLNEGISEETTYDFAGLDGTHFTPNEEGEMKSVAVTYNNTEGADVVAQVGFRVDTVGTNAATPYTSTMQFITDISSSSTDEDVAAAFVTHVQSAFSSLENYFAGFISVSGTVVTIVNPNPGVVQHGEDIDSGVTVTVTVVGEEPS